MPFAAVAMGMQHRAALMGADHAHFSGFADEGQRRFDAGFGEIGQKALYADAAHFFVIRQREMNGAGEIGLCDFGDQAERNADKAFHVRRTAAV